MTDRQTDANTHTQPNTHIYIDDTLQRYTDIHTHKDIQMYTHEMYVQLHT